MSGAVEKMVLCCHYCGEEQDDDTVVEAMLLHVQVEHDTDDVKLDLKAKCKCGMFMYETKVKNPHDPRIIYFRCSNGHEGSVRRR